MMTAVVGERFGTADVAVSHFALDFWGLSEGLLVIVGAVLDVFVLVVEVAVAVVAAVELAFLRQVVPRQGSKAD